MRSIGTLAGGTGTLAPSGGALVSPCNVKLSSFSGPRCRGRLTGLGISVVTCRSRINYMHSGFVLPHLGGA